MFAVGGKSHFWFGGIIQPTLSRRLLLVVVGAGVSFLHFASFLPKLPGGMMISTMCGTLSQLPERWRGLCIGT
jgi:hypothetical protein